MRAMFQIKDARFCAHDEQETSVYFVIEKWVVTNKNHLWLEYDNLETALADLHRITGIEQQHWTILQWTRLQDE